MRILVVLIVVLLASRAWAHDFRPGVLSLSELSKGHFTFVWTEPVDSNTPNARVTPSFPAHCEQQGQTLHCGARGLDGVAFHGLQPSMRVIVAIRWRDGSAVERVVTGDEPRVTIEPARAAGGWLRLGAEHVLGGLDHLAFVVGLLLLLRSQRRLVLTITAFTLAHSLTLALAVLDVVSLPRAPVEATIAASVVLVAREALHDKATATRRAPWAVALLFGLVHGLGFAGALRDAGLPSEAVAWPLIWFNVGVEIGQLGVVVLVVTLQRIGGRRRRARVMAAYAIGALGALWLFQRTWMMIG